MDNPTLAQFYRGKRVFLTGHTGFKGAWLHAWLQQLGAEVTGYALPPEGRDSLHAILGGTENARSLYADINDAERLSNAIKQAKPDIVFHLAAQPLVRKSYAEPAETFRTNIMGCVNLFEALRETPARAVVNITSDKCYRNDGCGTAFKEDAPLGGHDPYSASKAAAEIVTHAYRHSFFKNGPCFIASVRAGNVIGGGDFAADRIIPDIVAAIEDGQPVIIRSPNATRPWQHVLDAVYGYLLLGHHLHEGGATFAKAYNFGPAPERVVPVKELAETLMQQIGAGRMEIDPARADVYEAPVLALDSSLARRELKWQPAMDVDGALAFTAAWYAHYLNTRATIADYTRQQLRDYTQRLQPSLKKAG